MTTAVLNPSWPRLTSYEGEHLRRIALPLGGIGTGTVSLGGRGNLMDWEIMNVPAKGYTPALADFREQGSNFCIYTETQGKKVARCMEGQIDTNEFEGSAGCKTANAGYPRFQEARFHAAYPLGVVELLDEEVPLDVELRAMNPLIPGDSEASSLPGAMFSVHLHNPTEHPVKVSLCATFVNPIGSDGRETVKGWGDRVRYPGWENNVSEEREVPHGSRLFLTSTSEGPEAIQSPAYGDLCVTATGGEAAGVCPAWANRSWGNTILEFWDEFSTQGTVSPREAEKMVPQLSSLARKGEIAPGESLEFRVLLTWRFPNRMNWNNKERIGNNYAERFASSLESADYVLKHWEDLTQRTLSCVQAFCDSDLPQSIKEAALNNVSTLRTQTCFQTPDGKLFGWEGINDHSGCCPGSCTHVWNYEQTTPFWFSNLSRTMRDVEFNHTVGPEGMMRFRTELPLKRNTEEGGKAAADGQMGCIMKLYRDWKLSDDAFLNAFWPQVKQVMEFTWAEGSWDADQDGVMEGCQHNTMDVEYYGPNPQMQAWYLGALKAAGEMAEHLGDTAFEEKCKDLFTRGSAWTDEHLFNGEYYEHHIQMPEKVHPATFVGMDGVSGTCKEPPLQLGSGCLVDQLVGQYMAHVCGLGYLLNPDHVKTTLTSILKYNLKSGFHEHFNHMRSYVLGDETAALMATYPRGNRPEEPFPYYNEVMTGFEHQLAAHLIAEGMTEEGIALVGYIRERYDGKKRSPFDEAECGHHYARAMAAWAHVLLATGFHLDRTTGTLSVSDQPSPMFFTFGEGWGTWKTEGEKVMITLHEGELPLKQVLLKGKPVAFDVIRA